MNISRNEMIWKNCRDFILCRMVSTTSKSSFSNFNLYKWISIQVVRSEFKVSSFFLSNIMTWKLWSGDCMKILFSVFFSYGLSHFTKTCLLHVIVIKPKSLLWVAFPSGFVTSKSKCRFTNLKAERWRYQTKHQY